MTEFLDDYDGSENNRREDSQAVKDWRRAMLEPAFDYWENNSYFMPKEMIGTYVRDQGVNVPIIDGHGNSPEWKEALENGTAMLRSDAGQDYAGFSGLLSSKVLDDPQYFYPYSYATSDAARRDIGQAIARNLSSGELSVSDYMYRFFWYEEMNRARDAIEKLSARAIDFGAPQASTWRYIPGVNLTVFRDPSVDGKYHVKTEPQHSYVMGYSVFASDGGEISYERSSRPVPISEMINFYEQVRALPAFDATQAPVIEMQMDQEGSFHFLQYLKTGHMVDPIDPFDLPGGDVVIKTSNVRGATEPGGKDIRLYIAPEKVTERMEGQGFYFSMSWPRDLGAQVMSTMGSVVLHEIGIGMKDNHWDSSPLYRPEVGMGLYRASQGGKSIAELKKLADETRRSGGIVYVDARVTANGREATIESDWVPNVE